MTPEQRADIIDLLSMSRQFYNERIFFMPAIVFEQSEKEEVLQIVLKNGLPTITIAQQHEDEILEPLVDRLAQGKGIALLINDSIPAKVRDVLSSLHQSQMIDVTIGVETEPRIINPVKQGSHIILLMDNKVYKENNISYMISAVVNTKIKEN